MIERAEDLTPAPRTLIATGAFRDILGQVGERSIRNEINRFELYAGGVVASVELSRPDLIVERASLVRDLADAAESSGVEIGVGRKFLSAADSRDGLRVQIENTGSNRTETTTTEHLIGADGAFSRVARTAGWPQQSTVPLVQAMVACPAGYPSDTVRVWFRPWETPYFYWLIPDGDGTGALGLIGEARHEVRSRLDAFLHAKQMTPITYQAARIPLYTRWVPVRKRLRGGAVHLVGDAAGHVKSTTVGGLVTGFRGAAAVTDSILGRGGGRLRSLRRELDMHILLRRILHRFGEPEYKRLLGLMRPPEHRLLSAYSRDETTSLLWRLCVREPRLAGLAVRALIFGRADDVTEVSVDRPAVSQSSVLT